MTATKSLRRYSGDEWEHPFEDAWDQEISDTIKEAEFDPTNEDDPLFRDEDDGEASAAFSDLEEAKNSNIT